ncbi:MAG: hypothetical protein ACK5OW_00900 [bacterium]|jgi:hypothetical protein
MATWSNTKMVPSMKKIKSEEYITCAAIWYKDLPTQKLLPKNIDKGIVVCGHRHGNCIDIVSTLSQLRTVQFGPDSVGETEQGFMTSKNRFVDRIEAMSIAVENEQVNENELHNPMIGLFSEDLY